MHKLLIIASLVEVLTGIGLLALPATVCGLILGAASASVQPLVARLAGAGLLALGLTCWPRSGARLGGRVMLAYNTLAFVLLVAIGMAMKPGGVLLWPAAIVHGALSILIAARFRGSQSLQD